jgi:hypothetical protein
VLSGVQTVIPAGAPEHGQLPDAVLTESGMDWDTIMAYNESGAML